MCVTYIFCCPCSCFIKTTGKKNNNIRWESHVVYEPFLVEQENADPGIGSTFWNFYNAAGINEFGAAAEESGVANLFPGPSGTSSFPGLSSDPNATSQWIRNNALNPVLPSGASGAPDTVCYAHWVNVHCIALDPRIFSSCYFSVCFIVRLQNVVSLVVVVAVFSVFVLVFTLEYYPIRDKGSLRHCEDFAHCN